jgi:hypothetical protein
MRIPKPLQDLYREARKAGWTVEVSGSNHLRWVPPDDGRPVYSALTTRDNREALNVRGKLRRAGLKI